MSELFSLLSCFSRFLPVERVDILATIPLRTSRESSTPRPRPGPDVACSRKIVRSEIWPLGGRRSGPSSAPADRAIAGNRQHVAQTTESKVHLHGVTIKKDHRPNECLRSGGRVTLIAAVRGSLGSAWSVDWTIGAQAVIRVPRPGLDQMSNSPPTK